MSCNLSNARGLRHGWGVPGSLIQVAARARPIGQSKMQAMRRRRAAGVHGVSAGALGMVRRRPGQARQAGGDFTSGDASALRRAVLNLSASMRTLAILRLRENPEPAGRRPYPTHVPTSISQASDGQHPEERPATQPAIDSTVYPWRASCVDRGEVAATANVRREVMMRSRFELSQPSERPDDEAKHAPVVPPIDHDVTTLNTVAPGVVGLRVLLANVFALQTSHSWALVDTGPPGVATWIADWAEDRLGGPPFAIFLTHAHFDHAGSLAGLLERWDVPVYVHRAGNGLRHRAALVSATRFGRGRRPAVAPGTAVPTNGALCQRPTCSNCPTTAPFRGWRNGGGSRRPGTPPAMSPSFAPSIVCWWSAMRLPRSRPSRCGAPLTQHPRLSGPPAYFTTDWNAAAASVSRLAALEPTAVAPSHGPPISGPASRHRAHRLRRPLRQGGSTAARSLPVGSGVRMKSPADIFAGGRCARRPRPRHLNLTELRSSCPSLSLWRLGCVPAGDLRPRAQRDWLGSEVSLPPRSTNRSKPRRAMLSSSGSSANGGLESDAGSRHDASCVLWLARASCRVICRNYALQAVSPRERRSGFPRVGIRHASRTHGVSRIQ